MITRTFALISLIFVMIAHASSQKTLFVSIPPFKKMVEELVGEHVEVKSIIRISEIPHHWQPTPRRMKGLIGADAIILSGLTFEKKMIDRLGELDDSKLFNLWDSQNKIKGHHHHDEHHGHDAHEDSNDFDPHLWTSPKRLLKAVKPLASFLKKQFPTIKNEIDKNQIELVKKINALDKEIETLLKPYAHFELFFYHPAFNYLINDYGLDVVELENEGKMPGTKSLVKTLNYVSLKKIKTMWIQPQYSLRKFKGILTDYNLTASIADPLSPKLFQNIKDVVNAWVEEFKKREP